MATDRTTNIVRYNSRTFGEIREDLIEMIRKSYPEVLKDFTDSSIGSLLIELNAGVGNNLSMNTDRVFQETQLEYAQKRSSIVNIAKNLGFNVPPRRPSVSVVDFTVTIPVRGDSPDESYFPVLRPGASVVGGGKSFETLDAIDWNSPTSSLGDPNRSIIPNLDANGILQSYDITKREVVVNGSTKVHKRIIASTDVRPFFSITLPDPDVMEIDSIILLEGTSYGSTIDSAEFTKDENRFYEVEYLAQQRVFIDDVKRNEDIPPSEGLRLGKWEYINRKFIKEYTPTGYCKITFGSGDPDLDFFREGFLKEGVSNRFFLENFLKNTALGEKLSANHTLFIRYRVGGGSNSNVGAGSINTMGTYTLNVMGSRQEINRSVERSLTVENPIPAIGGNDGLSVEQIRHLVKYNFSSQNRDVTLNDYFVQVFKMPGRYGSPFKANAFRKNNKVVISILGLGTDGKLINASNTLLKENIAEYLTEFRMVNDYVEIRDGKIFNLAFDIELFVDDLSNTQISTDVIEVVSDYFDVLNNEMNVDVYLGRLERKILEVNGVINILDIKAFNKFGGQYSNNVTSQELLSQESGRIRLIDNTLYSTKDSMFEIKFPERDIRVFLKKRNQ